MRGMLAVMVALSLAGAVGAATDFPEEGVVLKGGEQLEVILGRVRVRALPNQVLTPMPDFDEIESRGRKAGHVQAERQRRHLRKKELKDLQFLTIGKGVGTEVLYDKGRDHAEKSKASAQRGQGSKSIVKGLLGGLFK